MPENESILIVADGVITAPSATVTIALKALPQLPNGLQNIALSFSGGGFRAAAFSLGCFSYLENIWLESTKLSEMVKFISSASGGSFANMAIVHAQRNGCTFDDAYQNLFNAMEGDCLLKRVLEILKTSSIWKEARPDKDRNFINGFAIAYSEKIFNDESFGILWNEARPGTVQEICVNSTDFTHGQQFRFQHDGTTDYSGEFGNEYLSFNESDEKDKAKKKETNERRWAAIKKIKLGDILAASSCFPAGFEPIMYPNDFAWKNAAGEELSPEALADAIESNDEFLNPVEQTNEPPGPPAYGLMDGGIIDNQGIDAFGLAENRQQTKQKDEGKPPYGYDLLAICDVSSNYTNTYEYPKQNKRNWFLKPSVLQYGFIILLLFILAVAGIVTHTWPFISYIAAGAFGFPIAVAMLALIYNFFKNVFSGKKKKPNGAKKLFGKHLWYFLNLPLSRVLNLLIARGSSLFNLAVVLFLKKIRSNAYSNHLSSSLSKSDTCSFISEAVKKELIDYKNQTGFEELLVNQKSWRQNTINPTVYLLSTKHHKQFETGLIGENWRKYNVQVFYKGKMQDLQQVLQPAPAIVKAADMGTNMPTTLWFSAAHVQVDMRAALIAAGQFTICHCLLRFAYRFKDDTPGWKQMQDNLLQHWEKFQNNPYWLYNEVGNRFADTKMPLVNFKPIS